MKNNRIVIKIGTNVLQRENGKLDYNLINELGLQISNLQKKQYQIIIVSSGAVGAGKELCSLIPQKNPIVEKQILASMGQVRLMQIYSDLFREYNATVAQLLLTRSNFSKSSSYMNILNTLDGLLEKNIIPIINENDVVSTEELEKKFGDNDLLAVYVAALSNTNKLFFLTSASGLMNTQKEELITKVEHPYEDALKYCIEQTSSDGSGGMESKVRAAGISASCGINTYIINGKNPEIIQHTLENKKIGTHFVASQKKLTSYQDFIASQSLK